MMEIFWTETAKKDLQHIYDFIAEDSVLYANRFIDKLINEVENLCVFPKIGRIVPEIDDINIREILYRSYRVIYKIVDNRIYITQISHTAQEFNLK